MYHAKKLSKFWINYFSGYVLVGNKYVLEFFSRVLKQENEYPCYGIKKHHQSSRYYQTLSFWDPKSNSFWKCKTTQAAHCLTDIYTWTSLPLKRDVRGIVQEKAYTEVYPSIHTLLRIISGAGLILLLLLCITKAAGHRLRMACWLTHTHIWLEHLAPVSCCHPFEVQAGFQGVALTHIRAPFCAVEDENVQFSTGSIERMEALP